MQYSIQSYAIETKETDRSEQSPRNIERNVGVELAARECLVAEYSSQGRRPEALHMLDRCESLLTAHSKTISPGFLAKDWQEVSKLSLELGFSFAALRRAELGLNIDTESVDLKSIRSQIEASINAEEAALLDGSLMRLAAICSVASIEPKKGIEELCLALGIADLLCVARAVHLWIIDRRTSYPAHQRRW